MSNERTEQQDPNIAAPDWSKIPAPEDDGAAMHLTGAKIPSLRLQATTGAMIDLSALRGWTVIYTYPRTGKPGVENPPGWDLIPGARGCTPQSCSFRDHFADLRTLGVSNIFGISTQDHEYQREAAFRLHLPFPLVSDHHLELTRALNLPTFTIHGETLLKRLILFIKETEVVHVIYPVFPPDESARLSMAWLSRNNAA